MVLVVDEPATTDLFPELVKEKSKGWLSVNVALASPLGLYPVMNALALTVALLVSVISLE
jgi:hypothetical protein